MRDVEREDTECEFVGLPVEQISNPELEAVGIRIFRPLPPEKDAKTEDYES